MSDLNSITSEIDVLVESEAHFCKLEECAARILRMNELINKDLRTFNILHLNIRSVNRNFEALRAFNDTIRIHPNIIVLSEC